MNKSLDRESILTTLCDLCEEKRATKVMRNVRNGNELNVCDECYEEIWGGKEARGEKYE